MQASAGRTFQTERKQGGTSRWAGLEKPYTHKKELDIIRKNIYQPRSSFENRKAKKFSREIRRKH